MRKIQITGGAGFVGRRFCKRYLDAGDQVYCVDPIAADTAGIEHQLDKNYHIFQLLSRIVVNGSKEK